MKANDPPIEELVAAAIHRSRGSTASERLLAVLLSEQRQIKTAIGIAVDAHWTQTGRVGGSEDLMAIQVDDWNEEMLAAAAGAKEHYSVLQTDRLITSHLSREEYPSLPGEPPKRRWLKHKSSRERFRKK